MTLQISGMGSGLDTASIIQQLMQVERMPQDSLKTKQQALLTGQTAWQKIATKLQALKAAADALSTVNSARSVSATSSNTSLVTATASSTAAVGTLTFWVNQLATAQQLASASFASSSTIVGAGTFNMTNGSVVGVSNVGVADSASKHTLVVTQASTAAVLTGTTAAALNYNGSNNSLTVSLNGTAKTISLNTSTSYSSASALATDIQTKLGNGMTVTANASGALVFTDPKDGSASTISVSGSAVASLGLTTTSAAGTDARGTVDGTAVTIAPNSSSVTLNGMLTVATGTHVGTGTVTATAVRTTSATATVTDLAAAINAAGGPASAAVVSPSATGGSVQLILTATQTGSANSVSISTSGLTGFSGTNSGFTTLQAAQDAQISLGGGMTITRSTNTVSDLMAGVTLNLVKADPTTAVTVSTAPDKSAMSTKVKALVDALNAVRTEISTDTAYNVAAKSGGALVGDSGARGLVDSLRSSLSSVLGTGATQTLSQLGITADRDGVYQYDDAKFQAAVTSDQAGAVSLLASYASKISGLAKAATDDTGVASTRAKALGDQAKGLQDQIDNWDLRLQSIQDRYQAQFTALDVAMQKMRDQSSWLAGQLGGLSSSSTGQ